MSKFINLSSSDRWTLEQICSIEEYSDITDIVDIPFPSIPPDYTAERVEGLAMSYAFDIEQSSYQDDEARVIHLAGELSFCVAFIKYFFEHGYVSWVKKNIKIVTSCSERISIDLGDGKKELQFVFKRFRRLL